MSQRAPTLQCEDCIPKYGITVLASGLECRKWELGAANVLAQEAQRISNRVCPWLSDGLRLRARGTLQRAVVVTILSSHRAASAADTSAEIS